MKTLSAGRLRHRVTLQGPVQSFDSNTGSTSVVWDTLGTYWAAIEPVSVRDFVQSAAHQSKVTARITLRYGAPVTPDCRLVHNGTIYYIEGILPDADSGREYLTLAAYAGVNEGG